MWRRPSLDAALGLARRLRLPGATSASEAAAAAPGAGGAAGSSTPRGRAAPRGSASRRRQRSRAASSVSPTGRRSRINWVTAAAAPKRRRRTRLEGGQRRAAGGGGAGGMGGLGGFDGAVPSARSASSMAEMQAAVGWEANCRAPVRPARRAVTAPAVRLRSKLAGDAATQPAHNRTMKLSAMPRAAQDEATLDVPPWTPRSQLSRLVTARTADDAESSVAAAAEPPPPSPRAKIHTPPWLRAGLEVRTPDDAASASSGSELPTPAESPLTPLLLKPTQPMMCADCGELYSPPSCTTCRCAALAKVSLGKPREVAVPADAVWPAVAPAVEAPAARGGAARGGGTVVAAIAAEVDLGGGAAARAGQPADVAVGRQRPRAKTWAAARRRRRVVIGLEARPQSRGHSRGRRRRRRLRARPRRPDDRGRAEKHGSLARRNIEATRVT